MSPVQSIIKFTENIIDYAGLFPPARLDLNTAFKNYLLYKTSNHKWILSKFICPVKKLGELSKLINDKMPFYISAIGSSGNTRNEFENNLSEDIVLWKVFDDGSPDNCKITSFEVKLPDDILNCKQNTIEDFIGSICGMLNRNISDDVFIFFECSLNENWKSKIKNLINSISIHNLSEFNAGLKIRTGGLEPVSFPASEQIVFCIRECLDRKVPVKFTAGLHHPFRHFDETVKTMSHGFINIFGAGIIAARHNITNNSLEEIINDEIPENFIFTDEYFSWKGWKVDTAGIKFARENLVISFGSCSVDEPVCDLKKFNLL